MYIWVYHTDISESYSMRPVRNESAKPGRTILALVSGENVALLSHKNVTSGLTSDFAVDFSMISYLHSETCT